MTVCPWFLEAAEMLNQNPGLDVAIHVAFNSEWEKYKWKPLTNCPSLCDEDGYLIAGRPQGDRDLKEAEAELRAQIELGLKYVNNVTHISDHMMWSFQPEMKEMAISVAREYGLRYQGQADVDAEIGLVGRGAMIMKDESGSRVSSFIKWLGTLEKGNTYWTIEHPGLDNEEMKRIYNIGFNGERNYTGPDRQDVTDTFTSPEVIKYIEDHGIELVSFGDLIREDAKNSRNQD